VFCYKVRKWLQLSHILFFASASLSLSPPSGSKTPPEVDVRGCFSSLSGKSIRGTGELLESSGVALFVFTEDFLLLVKIRINMMTICTC
jgi:hypothetical protein